MSCHRTTCVSISPITIQPFNMHSYITVLVQPTNFVIFFRNQQSTMSLKLITLAALGTAAQAATTYSKAKCITGHTSNLNAADGLPLTLIDSTAGYCSKKVPKEIYPNNTTKSILVKCNGTFLFYFPKCCLIIIFHLNFSFPVGFFFLSQVKK